MLISLCASDTAVPVGCVCHSCDNLLNTNESKD